MRLSRYLKIFPCPDDPCHLILYSTRRCSVLRVPEKTMQQIEEGTLPQGDRETLVRLGILVPDPEREREELLTRFDVANGKSRRFSAMVVLNLDCNLACGYCFEEGVRGKRTMSAETADLLVEWVKREQIARGRKVSIDFYGGEPLMSIDLIRSISQRLRQSCGEKGLLFEFSLVTNGTLLTRVVALELKALGMKSVKITLDGPREAHDLSRPFVSGRGSFDIIVKNILEIMDITEVQIGGNFTRENYREFPLLLDHLLAIGITPDKLQTVQFNQVIGRVSDGAIPGYASACNCTDEEWLFEATVFLREEILRLGFATPRPGPAGCMVEFANDLVVNVDGTIYKCPAFVGREGFSVGDLRSGIIDTGSVYNPGIWKNEECLECAWLPQCFGGCRFIKFLRDGDMGGVDCWKSFLDATLERCILQDLKYRPKNKKAPRSENGRPDKLPIHNRVLNQAIIG
jgi:uncharacterized protein